MDDMQETFVEEFCYIMRFSFYYALKHLRHSLCSLLGYEFLLGFCLSLRFGSHDATSPSLAVFIILVIEVGLRLINRSIRSFTVNDLPQMLNEIFEKGNKNSIIINIMQVIMQ